MRVKERIVAAGFFWLPDNPGHKIPGTLSIADGGEIELEVVGHFESDFRALSESFMSKEMFRILGHVEKYGLVTLDRCFFRHKNLCLGGGVSKSTIFVHVALLGAGFDESEELEFNKCKFSVEGIDEWVAVSGIDVEELEGGEYLGVVKVKLPDDMVYELDNGMTLTITFSATLPGYPIFKEAKCSQKTYFKLESPDPRPINDFISATYKITTFLCFAIDKTVCLDVFNVYSNSMFTNINGKKVFDELYVYYRSLPYAKEEYEIEWFKMLFQFKHIKSRAGDILNRWFKAYDIINPSLNLYFSAKTGAHKYLDGKFLSLAQCIETYHRRTSEETKIDIKEFDRLKSALVDSCPEESKDWLEGRLMHGNELSLSQRITRIIKPFKDIIGNSKDRGRLLRNIVDTRNYFTHYDKSLEKTAAKGSDLYYICCKLEAIFQLHLLHVIGFTGEDIRILYANNEELRKKINPEV